MMCSQHETNLKCSLYMLSSISDLFFTTVALCYKGMHKTEILSQNSYDSLSVCLFFIQNVKITTLTK